MNFISLQRMTRLSVLGSIFATMAGLMALRAEIPEPDNLFYGIIELDGRAITAADTDVMVQARRDTTNGPVMATYAMGSSPAAGNSYSLAVPVEAFLPRLSEASGGVGTLVHLLVSDASGVRLAASTTITARGVVKQIDFARLDSDGDGLSDDFEDLYFHSKTNGVAGDDPDHDGLTTLEEFKLGQNPTVVDGRHPADIAPADDRITIQEISEYILAWKTGSTNWPVPPKLNAPNIVDYVTRGGALWKGGEVYLLDNDPATNAPMFWVNPPPPPGPLAHGPQRASVAEEGADLSFTERTLPAVFKVLQPFTVSIQASPAGDTKAYAVVETPPVGWKVRNLSHQGRWDVTLGQIKWGPFFDSDERSLSYEIVPLQAGATEQTFVGRGSFDGAGSATAGASQIWASAAHPGLLAVVQQSSGLSVEIRGEPGRSYRIETAPDLAAPSAAWTTLSTQVMDSEGRATLVVPEDQAEARFFRLQPAQ